MIEQIVFYSLSAVTLLSALMVVTLRNTVHSALFLGLTLSGVAGLFAALGSDFLFAGQLMIYVGGIAVLIMFVVMLLGRASDLHMRQTNNQWMAALLIGVITLASLLRLAGLFTGLRVASEPVPTTRPLGLMFMGEYAVPFELISLVLIAALLGALFFSRTEAGPAPEQRS